MAFCTGPIKLHFTDLALMCEFIAFCMLHYHDVIMTTIASQITSLMVVYSTVYSDADQRKHQSSASLAFVWGIHRDRWIPRTKGQLRRKCFHLMTSSCSMWLHTWLIFFQARGRDDNDQWCPLHRRFILTCHSQKVGFWGGWLYLIFDFTQIHYKSNTICVSHVDKLFNIG